MTSTPPPDDATDAPRPSPRFATGRLLAGRYEVLDRIGEGGTAEVFRARDHRLDRLVAVKVLRPQYGQDADARTRFAVEARSAAALAVANIVPVYDFGAADDGSLFIVMRYIDGPSLRHVLTEHGPLTADAAVEIGRQVAVALVAAHARGLIHRDVKPGNILLDAEGTAHLTDFGTVKALVGGDDLTRTGMIHGTAAYLSPEQATGGAIGPRTDIYALGVVLYEALSGRPPFSGDDPVAVSYRQAHEDPVPLRVAAPDVGPDLERLVMQCLEKDPEGRPSTAQEVAARLESIADRPRSAGVARTIVAALAVGTRAAAVDPAEPADVGDETVLSTTVPPEAATIVMSKSDQGTVMVARSAGMAAPTVASHPSLSRPERGIAPPSRRGGARGDSPRGGRRIGAAIVLLTIAFVAVGTVLALQSLIPDDGTGVTGETTFTPIRSTRSTGVAIGPSASPTEAPASTPEPTIEPTESPQTTPEPPNPTPVPPQPTPVPPQPTPGPPQPTPVPPQPTPAPPPAVQEYQARIPDRLFTGDFDGQGSGQYHERSASWVYGQGTPYHTMTATFQLEQGGQAAGPATLEIVGLDGENPIKNRMSITLNGVTIYDGPNPLPNDNCCGRSGPGNWGTAVFPVAGEILQSQNSLVIRNLEPADCTACPKYVMVDFMVLDYRARP